MFRTDTSHPDERMPRSRSRSRSHGRSNRRRNRSSERRTPSRSRSRSIDNRRGRSRRNDSPSPRRGSSNRSPDRRNRSSDRSRDSRRQRSPPRNSRSAKESGRSQYGPQDGPRRSFRTDYDDDLFEERKRKRDATQFSIWSDIPSPPPMKKPTVKSVEAKPAPETKRQARSPSPSSASSSDSSSDSEAERRRRKRSPKKKKKRSKSRRKSKSKSKHKHKRRRRPSTSSSSDSEADSDDSKNEFAPEPEAQDEAEKFKTAVQGKEQDEDEDEEIGPQPLPESQQVASSVNYGKNLRPGEGQAIAQYVQKNMRIPRRGEVGWSGQEIEQLENSGYVMSGSRHQQMNAVRLRKENQVYTAEEKRALALLNYEEKQQRENQIMSDFTQMLQDRLTKKHGSRLVEDMEHDASAQPKE